MNTENLLIRINLLIEKANHAIATATYNEYGSRYVNQEKFNEFRTASLSFLEKLFSTEHTYYIEFNKNVTSTYSSNIESGRGILQAVKTEIENGWLFQIKDLVSAEIFSSFLEMSEYLLNEGYKDAAAVMIGSTLEEHLRQLCYKHNIPITFTDSEGNIKPKKADSLNADLAKVPTYNKLDQKNITAWLDLRNNAAHGKYDNYNKEQVALMYRGCSEIIARLSI